MGNPELSEVHTSTVDIAQKAFSCPFFNKEHGGCPFNPNHPHSFNSAKYKDCPAFKDGCPYKTTHIEKLKDCPAFKDGKCPFDGGHPIDLSKLKECPAFKNGCPYSKLHSHTTHANMNDHTATVHIASQASRCPFFNQSHGGCPFDPAHPHKFDLSKLKECPAFEKGCPFKGVAASKIKECPAFKDGKCPFDGAHSIDLSRIHECPAFKAGCPYSSLHAGVGARVHAHASATAPDTTQTTTTTTTEVTQVLQTDQTTVVAIQDTVVIAETTAQTTAPATDAARCPFAHLHGKVDNPHEKK